MADRSSAAVMNSNGCMTSGSIPAHRLHGRYDAGISAAPANVAAHALTHVLVGGSAAFSEQRDRRHDLTGRAVAALERVVFDERLLHGMELVAVRQTFDRCHMFAGDSRRKCQARQHAAAFDVDRARTALAVVAAFFRARQLKVFTKRVE